MKPSMKPSVKPLPKKGVHATKPAQSKGGVAKKPAAKKAAPSGTAPKNPKVTGKPIPGFVQNGSILIPESAHFSGAVVPPSKLSAGIAAAQKEIKKTLQSIASVFTQDFEVSEIELTVSFSADGKFLGFGAGGAMSVKVKICPSDT